MNQRPSLLPNLSVNRPVTMSMVLLAIMVIGAIAYMQIPVELMPTGFKPPFLGIWSSYPNSNPQEVEQQIARPIEEQVRTIPGVSRVETYSNANGCWTWLEFNGGTDMDLAYDQMRDRMERARAVLPDDFDRYYLRRFGRNETPVIFLSIGFAEEEQDRYFLVENYIKRPIERLDGVANIDLWGAEEKSIQIMIDQDKVKSHNINMFELIQEMRQDNFAMSSGWVYEGDKKFLVRSNARFSNIEDISRLPISKYGLTFADVATVSYAPQKRTWNQRINGGPGMLVEIYKESLANSVELSQQLKKVLNEKILAHPKLQNTEINILFVQGEYIEDSITTLRDTALWGGFFALFILLFFLQNVRMTIIMMVAIPLSILISLTVIYFIGWTLNLVTMMGLMISVGMVIDNGIVVLENIYHKRNQGVSPRKASIWGASEVNLAIIMATFTTIVVFVPMLLIEDRSGGFKFYMQRIGLPVIFALAASLFVALVLIPLATTRFSGGDLARENKIIRKLKATYNRWLGAALHSRMSVLMWVILILFLTFGVLPDMIKKVDEQDGNISDLTLMFDLPNHMTTEDADFFFSQVEDTVMNKKAEYGVRAIDTGFRRGWGRVRVYLEKPPSSQWYNVLYDGVTSLAGIDQHKLMSRDEVLEDMKKRLPKKPGVKFRTSWRGGSDEMGTVSIYLYGDDTGRLASLAEEVERRLRLVGGVISVETDRESGSDEIKVTMDREIVARNGIDANQVAYTLMYAVRGMQLPRFQARDKEIEMNIQLEESDRENLEQLKNISFATSDGRSVPLSAIASFQIEKGFGQVARVDGKTFLAVKARTTQDDLQKISRQIDEVMEGFNLPYGYTWEKGRRFRNFGAQGDAFRDAMFMSIAFVYLLMAILFESVWLPLSILLTIPCAFFGTNLLLVITNTPQDVMAGIGIIILVGVVVNNGIVLIDMINRRRREGFNRMAAILDAGQNRFRPILMTSLTTIFGLLPMAMGSGSFIGIPYAPMGRAIIGGMVSSTFLTLLIVPVFYTLFDDFSLYLKRVVGWLRMIFRGNAEIKLSREQ